VKLDARPLPTAPLKGRITSPDGRPIKAATIALSSIAVGDGCSFSPGHRSATSSATGRFSFGSVPKGTATLQVTHTNFAPRTVDTTSSSRGAEIVLDDGASWRGRVVDPDGEPVSACRVFASAERSVVGESNCSAGKFSLRHLPAGEMEIVVSTEEESRLGRRALTLQTKIVGREQREQDVSWPKGVTLAGVIIDADGTAIADARLSASPRRADLGSVVVLRADRSGHFTFRHLAPGPWTIVGDMRSSFQAKRDVDVTTDLDGLRLVVTKPKGR
jgi:hypothetical protein